MSDCVSFSFHLLVSHSHSATMQNRLKISHKDGPEPTHPVTPTKLETTSYGRARHDDLDAERNVTLFDDDEE